MQRILYCTDNLIAGGTEQQLVELVSRLDRHEFEPYVVCLYGPRAGRSLHFLAALEALAVPVIVLDLGWSARDKLQGVVGLVRLIRQLRPAIIHALNYHSNWLTRLTRPFVPWNISLITSIYVEYTRKQLVYERLFGWLDTLVVCNSPVLRDDLRAVTPNRRVKLIYNGIDLARFSPEGRSRVAPSAVFVGRITEQKAPHLLVEALGILKLRGDLPRMFQVTLIGECVDGRAQQLVDEAIQRFQLSEIVCQLAATDHVEEYFRVAMVSVLPSLWEGLPNVILESLACGCPVIVSEAANRAGIVRDGITGWVVPTNDAGELADALLHMLRLPSDAIDQMSIDCREAALPFSAVTMAHEYEQIYASLSSRS